MPLDGWIDASDGREHLDTRVRGSGRPGRDFMGQGHGKCCPCPACSHGVRQLDDTRRGYVESRMRSRGRLPSPGRPGSGALVLGHGHAPRASRHVWLWEPKIRRWIHCEPFGTREIAPGKIVEVVTREVPRGLIPMGGRWQVTPPNFLVHHAPPGLVPEGEHGEHVIGAPPVHVPGHYGWSPVLHKHVWIGAHQKGPAVAPSELGPQARAAFAHMAKLSKERATAYAHAHTFWGASGARTSIIPGHWQWEKNKKVWQYIEPHMDASGRPTTIAYAVEHAPPAAFGRRPAHVPPLAFWPDDAGVMRDVHTRMPTGATTRIVIPPAAAYAKAQGLLSSQTIQAVLRQNASALYNARVQDSRDQRAAMRAVVGR